VAGEAGQEPEAAEPLRISPASPPAGCTWGGAKADDGVGPSVSEAQIDQIAASMVEFGWTNPILVDENAGILAGHGRLRVACELGLAARCR
jgi:ParB-like nuclease domain